MKMAFMPKPPIPVIPLSQWPKTPKEEDPEYHQV
jgi:hypothetical protein